MFALKNRNIVKARPGNYSRGITVSLLVVLIIVLFSGEQLNSIYLVLLWTLVALTMGSFIVWISLVSGVGRYGVFIDPNRLKYSLSRFQVVIWTLIILSAYGTTLIARLADSRVNSNNYEAVSTTGEDKTVGNVGIPAEVLALLGISLASALISPSINNIKGRFTNASDHREESKEGTEDQSVQSSSVKVKAKYSNVLRLTQPAEEDISNIGALQVNKHISQANFVDIFRGEEVKNYMALDFSKIQQFLITLFMILMYIHRLYMWFNAPGQSISDLTVLPNLPENTLEIVGISHAYYIGNKAFVQSTPAINQTEDTGEDLPGDSGMS